jgi:acyl-CoA reductase-like NAD-dependent aldehyde dehydrogenase
VVWQGEYSKLFIGGRWVEPSSAELIDVVSPLTEELLARVPAASPRDVDRAVDSARQAFDEGPWPRMAPAERMEVLRLLGEELAEHQETLATLVTDEMGSPISLSRWYQAGVPKTWIDAYLEVGAEFPFNELRSSRWGNALITRIPVGVVAAVVPWNAPQVVTMAKLAPALLAGCTVVLKPAPETPLDSYLLAEMLQRVGLPDGVVNIVPAHRDASEHLVTHSGVDKVTFTGSTAAGQRIASLCGQDLRRVTLELGGKSAGIVLDDADLDATVESLRLGSFRNSGQICTLKTRLLVPRGLVSEFVDRLVAMVAAMPVGDPHDPATEVGPLVSSRQRDRVEGYIQVGSEEGAKVALGGGRPQGLDRGWFVEPTIFVDVEPSMRIAQEEIFGPVAAVLAYDTDDEAIVIANDSPYGLSGAVYTRDPERGLNIARRVRTGTVELNGSPVGATAPIGGFKSSGLGREAGPEGLTEYLEHRSIGLPAEVLHGLGQR